MMSEEGERRNSILMTYDYPHVVSAAASDCSTARKFDLVTNPSSVWNVCARSSDVNLFALIYSLYF